MKTLSNNDHEGLMSGTEPAAVTLGELEVRVLQPEEKARARQFLDDEHYLGAGREVGRTITQVVHHHGRWVALLVWGPAAMKLIDRDEWIGWTPRQCAERLGLVVQNRRFLVLAETRMPNLASRSLGLALRALPEHWESLHGYKPLLAETFTDIESFEGTCYKAAGWSPCGLTKGFERHRADFYREHKRPKKLWLKPLSRNTRTILCGTDVPPHYQRGVDRATSQRDLPLKRKEIDSLLDTLREVPDPRASNHKWGLRSLLGLICLALLAGRKNVAEIHRYGQFLTTQQRGWLLFPRKKNARVRQSPSYTALYHLLRKLDPEVLAETLNEWLAAHYGTLPRALALDGKYVRDTVLTLALSEHESGAPVHITIASKAPKSAESKTEGELTAAKRIYEQAELRGATITGDALHCERESAQMIVENGADFVLQLKGNQPNVLAKAKQVAGAHPPLFSPKVAKTATGESMNES